MANRDLIAMGASTGGLEAFRAIVPSLPAHLPAAILLVTHMSANGRNYLADILDGWGPLPALPAEHGDRIAPGRIYVAQPDTHLIVREGCIELSRTATVNRHRPSIDVLFRSVAKAYGRRSIGVVLSGMSDDGALGLAAIEWAGGLALVQDPDEAIAPDLPTSALNATTRARRLPAAAIAPALVALLGEPIATAGPATVDEASEPGEPLPPAGFSCPSCGGVLREMHEPTGMPLFRCHVGHAFSAAALIDGQHDAVEDALWAAIRALEEQAAMCGRLAGSIGESEMGRRLQQRERESRARAAILRKHMLQAST